MRSLVYLGSVCLMVFVLPESGTAGLAGGFGEERGVTPKISTFIKSDNIKAAIKDALDCTNTKYNDVLTPLKYKQQVVAGMNYIVSVRVGAGPTAKIIHVKIYKNLGDEVFFTGLVAEPGRTIDPYAEYKKCPK